MRWSTARRLVCLLATVAATTTTNEVRVLDVGREKLGEVLPLAAGGSGAVYQVRGLDPAHDYEIKVSYPASVSWMELLFMIRGVFPQVPAAFSLTLLDRRHRRSVPTRRLLNVEKIIFPARQHLSGDEESSNVFVRVSVKPAGVIAKRNVMEQEFIVYNIMCERVYFGGIPEQAWWIGLLAAGALLCSYFLANLLPDLLLGKTAKVAEN